MLQNQPYFQMALGVWQILEFTPPAAVIKGVMGLLKSFALPGFFPAYEKLRHCPGCLFKTVKFVELTKGTQTVPSNPQPDFISVDYLGETFEVKREGNKVFVNGEMSYYITDREWTNIWHILENSFKIKVSNEVVFVKGCRFIWEKVLTGKIKEFRDVLDDVILGNKGDVGISDNNWFLPVDLSEKSEGKLPKLLNLVGLFFSTHKKTSLILAKCFTIASAILEIKEVSSGISSIINKMFCRSMQSICNKLPYPMRRFVYLSFNWVENFMPRNDIQLKVVRHDSLNVFIGAAAKTNNPQEATRVDWLDQEEEKYEFRCGCSIVMNATYHKDTGECKATMQHTSAVFPTTEQRFFVGCHPDEFMKIGTFLSCLANSKAGALFKYDRNDNIVHVRSWKGSLRRYVEAGFPEIYKLTSHDVIV